LSLKKGKQSVFDFPGQWARSSFLRRGGIIGTDKMKKGKPTFKETLENPRLKAKRGRST